MQPHDPIPNEVLCCEWVKDHPEKAVFSIEDIRPGDLITWGSREMFFRVISVDGEWLEIYRVGGSYLQDLRNPSIWRPELDESYQAEKRAESEKRLALVMALIVELKGESYA